MCKLTRGERFKDARTVHNKNGNQSMDEVYTATGVSASMIKDLEDDEKNRSVGYDKVAALAKHYGVSADYLLGLSDIKSSDPSVKSIIEMTGLSEENVLRLIAWNNLDTSVSNFDDSSPKYIKEIVEDLKWIQSKESFSYLLFEFANNLLSSYLDSPRVITRWYNNYMYCLDTWYTALRTNSEHEIFCKADDIEKDINSFGLVTLTAEESAEHRLSAIMELLKDQIFLKAKKVIWEEIDNGTH